MASIYKHRDGWQASVTVRGVNAKRNFPTANEAKRWASAQEASMMDAHAPRLGGPTKCTVAQLLFDYAQLYTVEKKSIKTELDRINRYLTADGLPALGHRRTDAGKLELFVQPERAQPLPRTFEGLKQQRHQLRAATHAFREKLAAMRVSTVSTDLLREFMAVMHTDGLSDSTRQKEAALLKHALNVATREWNWSNFKNPFVGLKIPKGGPGRQRVMSPVEEARLMEALLKCDNPFILPYLILSVETTARRSSLLLVKWSDVNLVERWILFRDTKNGEHLRAPLTRKACELLSTLPRDKSDLRVLPTTAEALGAAWERACARAGIEDLRVHDMRHTGTTRHAKTVRSTHLLKMITGHKSDAMLARYIHFSHEDLIDALDGPEPLTGVPSPDKSEPAAIPENSDKDSPPDADMVRRQKMGARLNAARCKTSTEATPTLQSPHEGLAEGTEAENNVVDFANFRASRTA